VPTPLIARAAPGETKPAVAAVPSFESEPDANVDAGTKEHARAIYERGARAYAEARYSQAAELFLDANRIFPTPQLLFNIAKAYDRLGHSTGALAYYRDYLRKAADAVDRQEVSARVRELELQLAQRGVQQFSVITDPDNAMVSIDGRTVGLTPWTGEIWPGKHRVRLELAGHLSAEEIIELEPLHAKDLTVKLALEPAKAAPKVSALPAPPAEPAKISTLTWVVLATGTAALGAALFVEMANADREGVSRTGAFFAGAGLAGSTLGGLLLYADLSATDGRSPPPPALRARRVGVSVAGHF
jgi:tetratricopeptide (TPR) repeat protein